MRRSWSPYSCCTEHPGFVSRHDPKWSALLKIVLRPWFKRLWVQQEVILASSVSMVCGTDWISWDDLSESKSDHVSKPSDVSNGDIPYREIASRCMGTGLNTFG